jgi:hypothetical protein
LIGGAFVVAGFVPIWDGRVRLDGIPMPAAFLPIMRAVDFAVFGGAVAFAVWQAAVRGLVLRVDESGITLGGAVGREAGVVGWPDLEAVELIARPVQAGRRMTAVPYARIRRAVTMAAGPAGDRTDTVSRSLHGVRFDVERFTAVVRHHRPDVPIMVSPDFRTP